MLTWVSLSTVAGASTRDIHLLEVAGITSMSSFTNFSSSSGGGSSVFPDRFHRNYVMEINAYIRLSPYLGWGLFVTTVLHKTQTNLTKFDLISDK